MNASVLYLKETDSFAMRMKFNQQQ